MATSLLTLEASSMALLALRRDCGGVILVRHVTSNWLYQDHALLIIICRLRSGGNSKFENVIPGSIARPAV
jgi:hypothetical protein